MQGCFTENSESVLQFDSNDSSSGIIYEVTSVESYSA